MEAMNAIKSDLATRLAALQYEKKKGKKIVGYLPGGYFPEELALASGAIPLCMIRGGDHAPVEASIAYVDRWLDTFYRAQIGYGVSGEDPYYNLVDALVVPITDSNNRALSDVLDYHTPLNIVPFGVPHTKTPSACGYYLHGLNRIKGTLEQITGVEITGQRLGEEIERCNRERELLREISLMRKSAAVPIRAAEFVSINHASMLADKGELIGKLEACLEELREAECLETKGPRLLLTGSTLALGDYKILELIEEAGGAVVIEEFAEGIQPYWQTVRTDGDPMQALAQAYFMDRVVPAWFRPGHARFAHLIDLAREYRVEGVIWYQLLYRESYKMQSYYFPEVLRKEAGLSTLTLESDYDPAETAQMSTRIESYMESLRRNP